MTVGAMVEPADQLHWPFECMKAAVAMVADVHHPPTGRTSTVEDVEFPQSEIGIRRPFVRHPADLHVPVQSVECEAMARGYVKKPCNSSSVSGHCFLSTSASVATLKNFLTSPSWSFLRFVRTPIAPSPLRRAPLPISPRRSLSPGRLSKRCSGDLEGQGWTNTA